MNNGTKAFFMGLLASAFFACTFIFNRLMNLTGGFWMWSGVLRYFFTLPMLWIALKFSKGSVQPVFEAVRMNPKGWFLWSTVGFGLFYTPMTLASVFGESWFTAATWQLTIVAGVLTTPLFGKSIPFKNIACSAVILVGVALLQASNVHSMQVSGMVTALILIIIAAFAYPLGNRKMMSICPVELSSLERVFGMTLCSIPYWAVLAVIALFVSGAPTGGQALQCVSVALFSGTIATLLFFGATDMVKSNPRQLAYVEAAQSGEVLFTLLGGVIFLGDALPTALGFAGIAVIIAGMIGNSLVSR